MLDIRLMTCFEMVGGNGTVCDVGTDHALLAAELINSGKCSRVIASDIKEGPLESAEKTVEKYGIADKVDLVLSDGLANVPLDGVSDIVIAGMGGETIADIIENCDALRMPENSEINLVLQPMTKAEILRKKLYEMGYAVSEEKAVIDGEKIYTIISAQFDGRHTRLTEFEAAAGFFAFDDMAGRKYRFSESERFSKVSTALKNCGRESDSVHAAAMSEKLRNGTDIYTVSDIYSYLDSVFPFDTQEKWDNSGLLINSGMDCGKVLLTLDIDKRAVEEAELKGADMVISHHPVIFSGLKSISSDMPVYRLVQNDISAICMHTNVDKSPLGTNGVILRELKKRFEIEGEPEYINYEECGYICTFKNSVPASEFAKALKEIFNCKYIRVSAGVGEVQKVGFCSGSGGSFVEDAAAAGCDAFVTGDVKHDVWMTAENYGLKLFDCGHFHTENPVLWEIRRILEEKFPRLDVEIAESTVDPCIYF